MVPRLAASASPDVTMRILSPHLRQTELDTLQVGPTVYAFTSPPGESNAWKCLRTHSFLGWCNWKEPEGSHSPVPTIPKNQVACTHHFWWRKKQRFTVHNSVKQSLVSKTVINKYVNKYLSIKIVNENFRWKVHCVVIWQRELTWPSWSEAFLDEVKFNWRPNEWKLY